MLEKAKDVGGGPAAQPEQPSNLSSTAESKQPIYAHCLDFTEGEQEYFYVGSEDFNIY